MATLYILFGKSTAGKDSVLQRLEETELWLTRAVRTTSRPMREGEVDGVDYNFVELPPLGDEYFECNIYNGWFYGTHIRTITEGLERGDLVMTGSYHSVEQVIQNFQRLVSSQHRLELIYLDVSEETQLERIKLRGPEHLEEGMRRIQADKRDYPSHLSEAPHYTKKGQEMAIIGGYALYSVDSNEPLDKVVDLVYNIIKRKGAQPKHDK